MDFSRIDITLGDRLNSGQSKAIIKPTEAEKVYLEIAFNRFYDLFDELMNDDFWEKESWVRFSKVSQIFAVYSELLNYEPIAYVLETIKISRPPLEAEIGSSLFKFIRNVLTHFPLYSSWDEVWVTKELINWHKEGLTIDSFLIKYSGQPQVKYRFWDADKKLMTYTTICFPNKYDDNKIHLKDIITEKEGVKFSIVMMKTILNTQVERDGE